MTEASYLSHLGDAKVLKIEAVFVAKHADPRDFPAVIVRLEGHSDFFMDLKTAALVRNGISNALKDIKETISANRWRELNRDD